MRLCTLLKTGAIATIVAICSTFGQSGDFVTGGKVVNSSGQAIPMATITYTSIGQRLSWDFSKTDGTFGSGTAVLPQSHQQSNPRITLAEAGPVTVDIFDVTGKRISTVSNAKIDKGTYSIDLAAMKLPKAMYVLKIKAGDVTTYERLVNAGSNAHASSAYSLSATASGSGMVLAKPLAALDTVRVGKTGYNPVYVAISAYASDIGTVTLTTLNIESMITTYMNGMSTAQIEGQLCMPPTPVSTGTATGSSIGAVFGGGGSLSGSSASACASTMNGLQNAMMSSGTKIPLLAAYDFVHGASAVPGATMLPHNLALGAIQDTLLIQKAWRVAALEVRGSGCNWGFGPCIAVIRDDRWGRAYEGFTEDPTRCQLMARHAVLGCQTTDLSLPMAYAACVKHFAGDGNTVNGVNQGTTVGPDATARAINLPGYASAVAVGAASVMPSFTNWCDGTAMSFNSTLMTGWLKSTASGNPGFMGFIVSDWEAGSSNWGSSINAGMDVPMAPGEGTGIIGTINGIYGARVQDACKRVLRIKCQMNLFSPSQYLSNPQLTAVVGSAPHRAVARQCVRESMVLLKTGNAALPIPKTASVAVWGQGADDIGIQCGGWTVSWQGQTGSIPGGGGTSIRTGIAATCTGTVTYSNNGSNSGNATYVIAVLSENPYAETSFNDISLTNDMTGSSVGAGPANTNMATSTNSAVIAAIATAHAAGKKVIGILVAGRPLDISGVLPNCDAFIWACLPGTEGNGVADCLFGDYNFKGKLPVTWPKASGQLQTDNGTTRSNGLFAYGFGLSY